jgi:hypothetical protein
MEIKDKMDEVQHELDLYKNEYARLYNETLPELIPEYIEDNHDAMDEDTLNTHVDYIQRTKRDVQFLINIIKSNFTGTPPSTPAPVKLTTTPNPFKNFSNLYTNHKKATPIHYLHETWNHTSTTQGTINTREGHTTNTNKTFHKQRHQDFYT